MLMEEMLKSVAHVVFDTVDIAVPAGVTTEEVEVNKKKIFWLTSMRQ